MQRNSYHPLVLTIIGLAIVGLGYRIVTDPGAFVNQILVTVGIVTILILVMIRFVIPRIMRNRTTFYQSHNKFQKAARKQHQQPIPFKPKNVRKKRPSRPLVKRQSNVKLTVIEGKKNKKKNRALF